MPLPDPPAWSQLSSVTASGTVLFSTLERSLSDVMSFDPNEINP
eukprot:COSAG02_NODE_39185_length_420_cov_0.735202_1_plen_43_part_01